MILNQSAARMSLGDARKTKSRVRCQSGSIDMWYSSRSTEQPRSLASALDEAEPDQLLTRRAVSKVSTPEMTALDEAGFNFVRKCIALLEKRGLEDQGLYRIVGVSSRVNRLLAHGLDPEKMDKLVLDNPLEWENKTVTSAIKTYFRNLPEPLVTHRLHNAFLDAAKLRNKNQRITEIAALVDRLPRVHHEMLKLLIQHLVRVASKSHANLMSVGNLGVCFGPTLFRPEEDPMAAIMDIRFCNMVVEILITNFEQIFCGAFQCQQPSPSAALGVVDTPSVASVAASAAAQTSSAGEDELFKRVSQPICSSPSVTSQPSSNTRCRSPKNSSDVKRPPANSSSHSSLVSALGLAPVTHTIVTSYNVETPRPVLMESKYGVTASGQRRQKRESRLSTHALLEALPCQNSVLSSPSSSPMFSNELSYRISSSAPSSASTGRQHVSPKSCAVGGDKAVNKLNPSTSVESLAATGFAKRRHGPELRCVLEDSVTGEANYGDSAFLSSWSSRPPFSSCVTGDESPSRSGCANSISRGSDSSEARKRSFYLNTTQPQSLLDLRFAGVSASSPGIRNILTSKSMEGEHPVPGALSNGGASALRAGADSQPSRVSGGGQSEPPSLAFRPNPLLNLLNSTASSTESVSSTRSSKEPSTSPKSRCKFGPNPPKYRSQDPVVFRSTLGGGLSSLIPSSACGSSCGQGSPSSQQLRRVRTIFACVGENEAELSFEPNQIITNVRPSKESGWLEGTLNGHQGLVPENYVEYLP